MVKVEIKSSGKNIVVFGNKIDIGKRLEQKLSDKGLLKKDLFSIGKLVRDKITSNLYRGKRFDTGGNVAALKQSTIKRKGFSKPFQDTGKLVQGVIVSKEGGEVIVRMKNTKYGKRTKGQKRTATVAEVMEYLQKGNQNMVARPAFGITKKDATMFTKLVLKERFNI